MKIHFERSGGFAGLHMESVFDTHKLPKEESDELNALVQGSSFFDLPSTLLSPPGGADRFSYRITVEQGDRQHTVEFGEAAQPESIQPLVQKLVSLSRNQR